MDPINITITENQSNNFFSRLQQQINQSNEIGSKRDLHEQQTPEQQSLEQQTPEQQTPEQQPPEQQTPEQQSPEQQPPEEKIVKTNDFLSKINSTSKNLGHNKLQLRIDDLENQIVKYKVVEKEQEMKLNLFKKTIATLQGQLQDKSAYISRIESSHIDPQYDKRIQDLHQEISSLKIELDNVEKENVQMKLDVDFINNKLEATKIEYANIVNKNTEVQQRYDVLEQVYQKGSNQLQMDLETISRLENKINLELNIRQNLELELQTLKLELADYRTDIKNITIMKDNEIKLLTDKLNESNKPIPEISSKQEPLVAAPRPRESRRGTVRVSRNTRAAQRK